MAGVRLLAESSNNGCSTLMQAIALITASVPSRVRYLRKMHNFWANFTDFEPEINITKCKTKKLEYFNTRL